MVNPDTLADAIATALQSCTALMAQLGRLNTAPDAGNVYVVKSNYEEGRGNISESAIVQPPGTILIYWSGTRTTRSRTDSIKHDFTLCIKPEKCSIADLFMLIREGVVTSVTGDSRKFKLVQLHSDVDPLEGLEMQRRTEFISGNYGLYDFNEIHFTLVERGIDN